MAMRRRQGFSGFKVSKVVIPFVVLLEWSADLNSTDFPLHRLEHFYEALSCITSYVILSVYTFSWWLGVPQASVVFQLIADLWDTFHKQGMSVHCYADGTSTPLCVSAKPDDRHQINRAEQYWMLSNLLLIYYDKIENILLAQYAFWLSSSLYVLTVASSTVAGDLVLLLTPLWHLKLIRSAVQKS